jgi:hypothetical protein
MSRGLVIYRVDFFSLGCFGRVYLPLFVVALAKLSQKTTYSKTGIKTF